MDTILSSEILKALQTGDYKSFVAYGAIFIFIWLEVRGLKKEVKNFNETILAGFTAGNDRFTKIESRLTNLEIKQPSQA